MINWTEKPVTGDERQWNGVYKNRIIELRKTFARQPHYAQILIVITSKDDATLSVNGKASLSPAELIDIGSISMSGKASLSPAELSDIGSITQEAMEVIHGTS